MNLREQNKENNKQYIAKIAFKLFCEQGIENVSIPQVAKTAGVGTTSVYRYFETKIILVAAAATAACQLIRENIYLDIDNDEYRNKTGMEQLEFLLNTYLKIFDGNKNILRFIYQFENYMAIQKLDHDDATRYRDEFLVSKQESAAAFEKGFADGSIRKDIDRELLCLTVSDFILGFCSKMAYYELYRDRQTFERQREQLKLALDITGSYLKVR